MTSPCPSSRRSRLPGAGQGGAALLAAVLATLALGLLAASLVLLGDLEARATAALRAETRAEALALAGLEHAASTLGPAAAEPCGFTRWTAAAGVGGCGPALGRQVLAGVSLGGGQYAAYADNDCGPLVGAPGQDPACATAVPGRDDNAAALLTAVGEAGGARARARALLVVDQPWEHVCATDRADAGGWCGAESPIVTLVPADPGARHGPRRLAAPPRPVLGCSRVDPALHARPGDPPGAQAAACAAWPGAYEAPYPPHQGPGTPRFVVMGADPAVTPGAAACDGGGQPYFGHFDCALTTPCPAAVCGAVRRACVRPGDTRAVTAPEAYVETVAGACPVIGGVRQRGLVFAGDTSWAGIGLGAPGAPVGAYVLSGRLVVTGGEAHGTLVVEGPGGTGACGPAALALGGGARVTAAPPGPGAHYGGPVALLVYDPAQPPPAPGVAGQDLCLALGPAEVQGLVYAAGAVLVDGAAVTGALVAWRGSAGPAAGALRFAAGGSPRWAPGFPPRAGAEVRLLRRTLARCERPADDGAAPGPCS